MHLGPKSDHQRPGVLDLALRSRRGLVPGDAHLLQSLRNGDDALVRLTPKKKQ